MTNLTRWTFYKIDGTRLADDWQGDMAQAKARARALANEHRTPVSYTETYGWDEGDGEPFMHPDGSVVDHA